MLDEKLHERVLVDELQLGNRLNESVTKGDRADFQLLLSMLSQDVCDAPQFSPEIPTKKDSLRERFALGEEQRFYAETRDFEQGAEQSVLLHEQGLRAVFFSDCLKPTSLCEYERKIAPEVFSELSPLDQGKFLVLNDAFEKEGSLDPKDEDSFEILKEVELGRTKVYA